MTSKGIDYSHGQANVDHETGIHYGVIPMNALSDWAHEGFEDDYGEPHCPNCGNPVVEYDDDKHTDYSGRVCDYACEACARMYDSEDCYPEEPIERTLDDGEYEGFLDGSDDVWIVKSPYYTYASYCSPCAPGACYLTDALPASDEHPRAYCLGVDWFERGRPPYDVYRVDTQECLYRVSKE